MSAKYNQTGYSVENMKHSSIRLLFVFVIVVFFMELLLSINITEPFPAIMYPSFSDIPTLNSEVHKPSLVVFFENNDSIEVDKKVFFYNLSNVYSNVILNENFKDNTSFLSSLREVRELDATLGTKKITLGLDEVRNEAQIQEGKDWVALTLKNILKRDDVARLEVQWYDYTLTKDKQNPLKQGKLIERFVVSFIN